MFSNAQSTDEFFGLTDKFFSTHVSEGLIDYETINKNPSQLNELIMLAENIDLGMDHNNVFKAFYINVYNLAVIKGVIDHYPTTSPLSISGFFDKITYRISGESVTLNDIEHKILRGHFKDPRIHFVLVCGAIGCPPIIDSAYHPDHLDQQMDEQTRLSLNGEQFLQIDEKKKRIIGSQILKWYKEDFTMSGKSEIDFINLYREDPIPSNYKLTYSEYDWRLNQK